MMSDNQMLMRMLIAIGLVMLLVSALYPGANPAWANLQTQLSTGPSFPQFGQPFALQAKTVDLVPVGNGTWGLSSTNFQYGQNAVSPSSIFNNGGPVNCGAGSHIVGSTPYPGQYWPCITQLDGQKSGVVLGGVRFTNVDGVTMDGYQFGFQLSNITGIDLNYRVLNVTVTTECNTNTGNPVDFFVDFISSRIVLGQWPSVPTLYPNQLSIGRANPVDSTKCGYGGLPGPFGTVWYNVTNYLDYQRGVYVSNQILGNFSGSQLAVTIRTWGQALDISYMHVRIAYLVDNTVTNQKCASDLTGIGCVIANIWNSVSTWFAFAGGILLFAYNWVSALLIFVGSLISNFVIGLITVLIWFLTMPGLDVPVVAKGFISVMFIGMLGFVFYSLLKIIRGGGGT